METVATKVKVVFHLKNGQKLDGVLPSDFSIVPRDFTENVLWRLQRRGPLVTATNKYIVLGSQIDYIEVL